MSKRRQYSPEYKCDAVQLARQSGVSYRQFVLEQGIEPNPLSRWKREADQAGEKAFGGTEPSRDREFTRLTRELARVKKEQDLYAKRQRTSPKSRPERSCDPALPQ